MMKSLVLAAVAALLVSSWGATATAADIPNSTLAQMGLGGMKKMSDSQGMRVRGQGFAGVAGAGFSSVLVASDLDGYVGSSLLNNALATGSSQTLAQVGIQIEGALIGIPAVSLNATIFAGTAGSSFAFAR